jgi:tetratricopeptide (TPR) repeat protein
MRGGGGCDAGGWPDPYRKCDSAHRRINTMLISSSPRLNRFLAFVFLDGENLVRRKDAICVACETGHFKIARKLIEGGLEINGRDGELLLLSGLVHLHAKQYPEAELALRAVLDQGWESDEVHYGLAFALMMQRRYADAFEHMSES